MRTNIYLEKETIFLLKQKAQVQNSTMASVIRQALKKAVLLEKKDWGKSLLFLAKKAGKSKIGDLSKRHNDYLYGPKKQ